MVWTESQQNDRNKNLFWAIEKRKPHSSDEWDIIHTFNGSDDDMAHDTFNRMKRIYNSLPEFNNGYFAANYRVRCRTFDRRKALDTYPDV